MDMHEVVTRGMARNVDVNIFVPENSVLLHTGKCHLIAQHEDIGKTLCTDQLIHYEGFEKVYRFREKVIANSHTLGEISMKKLKSLIDALEAHDIKATGTIENAIQLGKEHRILKGWSQDAKLWGLHIVGKRNIVATVTPVETILEALLESIEKKSKNIPAKEEKQDEGEKDE